MPNVDEPLGLSAGTHVSGRPRVELPAAHAKAIEAGHAARNATDAQLAKRLMSGALDDIEEAFARANDDESRARVAESGGLLALEADQPERAAQYARRALEYEDVENATRWALLTAYSCASLLQALGGGWSFDRTKTLALDEIGYAITKGAHVVIVAVDDLDAPLQEHVDARRFSLRLPPTRTAARQAATWLERWVPPKELVEEWSVGSGLTPVLVAA